MGNSDIKNMNSDKQSKPNTTESANLAKARTKRDRPTSDLARPTGYHKMTKCKIHRVSIHAMNHIHIPSFIMKNKEDSCQNS
jgi:hypothetical protein